jgi:hypothetical protein
MAARTRRKPARGASAAGFQAGTGTIGIFSAIQAM